MFKDLKTLSLVQVPRTLLVGGVATLVDFLALIFLVSTCHVSPQMANVPCLILGSVIQFFGNRHYVFKAVNGLLGYQVLGFFLAELGALAVNAYGYYALTEYTAVGYVMARVIANGLTFFCFSFPLWRKVFKVSIVVCLFLPYVQADDYLASSAQIKHPLDERIPEAIQSPYSDRLFHILRKWPRKELEIPIHLASPVWIQPIQTKGNKNYIGSFKSFMIHAAIEKVVALIDDFEHYKDLFQDLNEVRVIATDGNKITTSWDRPSPVFFVSNTRYEQIYIVDKRLPDRVVYRYQLKKGNHVNFSDGIIILEKKGDDTLLSGFDFFEADWGLLRALAESSIWNASLEGAFKGDLTLKAKAEHPGWEKKQIEGYVKEMVKEYSIDVKWMRYLDLQTLFDDKKS